MQEPEYNIYIINDVENFRYNKDFLELFGEFDTENNLKAVLVRYFNILNLYAKDKFDISGFAAIINNYDTYY